MTDWTPHCVLCAARGRATRLDAGHCCVACMGWLTATLADIGHLVADAAAAIVPPPGTGSGSRPVPGSRPPIDLDAVDPANVAVLIAEGQSPTLLECVESWERLAREMRGMAPYGPASASRIVAVDRPATRDEATLYGVLTFLGRQVPWMATETGFPLEDFAAELRACLRAVRRWDRDRDTESRWVVQCPSDGPDGSCGYRLHVAGVDVDDEVTCRRCRTTWPVAWLMRVAADTSDAEMLLDGDAVCHRFGVDRKTLDRWVREGRIAKRHGLYDAKPIVAAMHSA